MFIFLNNEKLFERMNEFILLFCYFEYSRLFLNLLNFDCDLLNNTTLWRGGYCKSHVRISGLQTEKCAFDDPDSIHRRTWWLCGRY